MEIDAYPDLANNALGYVRQGYRDFSEAYRVYRDWRLRQGVTSSLQRSIGPLNGPVPASVASRVSSNMVSPWVGTGGAVGPITQVGYSRTSRRNSRRFVKNIRNLYKRVQLSTLWRQCRWEGITNMGNSNGYGKYWLSNYYSAANVVDLPVYAFNLSDLDQTYNNAASKTYSNVPMYRLKGATGATGAVNNYTWSYVGGSMAHIWTVEDRNSSNASENAWRHNWSDIKLLLYGAKNRPIKFHLYVCTFPKCAGPNRYLYDGTSFALGDSAVAGDDIDAKDVWWEHFLAPKVYNPLRTSKYTSETQMHVLHHESFVVGNDLSTNNDTAPIQMIKKLFYRNGNYYRSKAQSNANEIGVGNLVGDVTFDTYTANESAVPLANRDATQWLMIVAEVFDNITYGGTQANTTQPSFDIVVRNKWEVVN